MEDLTELKAIWTNVPDGAVPDFHQVTEAVRRYRRKNMIKTLLMTLLMLLLASSMCWVVLYYDSQLLSTRIGEGLMMSAIMIMLSYTAKTMRRLRTAIDIANGGFLTFLKNEQLDLFRFQKRTQVIGFVAASTGLLMYLYEGVSTSPVELVVAYALAIAWIAGAWLVVRPLVMRRKMNRINEKIRELERISQQLNN